MPRFGFFFVGHFSALLRVEAVADHTDFDLGAGDDHESFVGLTVATSARLGVPDFGPLHRHFDVFMSDEPFGFTDVAAEYAAFDGR